MYMYMEYSSTQMLLVFSSILICYPLNDDGLCCRSRAGARARTCVCVCVFQRRPFEPHSRSIFSMGVHTCTCTSISMETYSHFVIFRGPGRTPCGPTTSRSAHDIYGGPGFGCYMYPITIWSCDWRDTHMVPVVVRFQLKI